jgi:hypothetical protein
MEIKWAETAVLTGNDILEENDSKSHSDANPAPRGVLCNIIKSTVIRKESTRPSFSKLSSLLSIIFIGQCKKIGIHSTITLLKHRDGSL